MITAVDIRRFRGIRNELQLELAPLSLLAGRNGLGKTTVFDAIDWCLFGSTSRLGAAPSTIANLYATGGEPYVAVTLVLTSGSTAQIERTTNSVKWNGRPITDRDLAMQFASDPDLFPPYQHDPGERLRQFCYLPQETLRQIVSGDANVDRAALLDALIGVPHAAVASTSIRKIRDRLAERRRSIADAIDAAVSEQRELNTQRQAFDSGLVEDEGALLGRLLARLGLEGDPVVDAAQVLAAARERLTDTVRRQSILRETIAFVQEMEMKSRDVEDRLAKAQSRTAQLEKDIVNASARVIEVTKRLEELQERRQSLEQQLRNEVEQARISKLRRDTHERLAALGKMLESARAIVTSSAALRDNAQQIASEAEHRLGRERTALQTLEGSWSSSAVLRQNARERESVVRQIATVVESRGGATARLEIARATAARQAVALEEAREAQAAATANLEAIVRQASAREALSQHIRAATVLVGELGLTSCPLCGTAFPDVAAVTAHALVADMVDGGARETATEASGVLDTARGAFAEASRLSQRASADIEASEREIQLHSEQLADLQGTLSGLQKNVADSRSSEVLDVELASISDRLELQRAAVSDLEGESERKHQEFVESQVAAERATREVNDLISQVVAVEESDRSTGSEKAEHAEAMEQSSALTRQNIQDVIQELEGLERERGMAERELSAQRSVEATAQSDAAAAGSEREKIEAEIASRMRVALALASSAPSDARGDRLAAELAQLGELRERLESEIPGIETLVLFRERRQQTARLEALASQTADLRTRDTELARAEERFASISSAIEVRRTREGREALGYLQAMIQECLRDMSTHMHLDQVSVHADGSLLLSDVFIKPREVQMDAFTSTGQQNVLALAVFLAVALREAVSSLGFVLLDEPVQNLDDLNFLAFVALLKRVVQHRQVIFSTADGNVETLVARQLRGWSTAEFAHYRWEDFTAEKGPSVERVNAPNLRLASGAS